MARTVQPDLQGPSVCEPEQAVSTPDPDSSVTDLPAATENDLLKEELLVEEISIDGMCGVY